MRELIMARSKLAILILIIFAFATASLGQISAISPVEPSQSGAKLVIGTRHDSIIYTRFAEVFVQSSYAADVGINSVDDIEWYNPSTYDAFKRVMTLDQIGADLGWGGGPTLFNTLALDGALDPITDPATLAAINEAVPDQIAGADMKQFDSDGKLIWASNAISSFGFTVNHDVLEARGLEVPRTWDLRSEII